MTSIDNLNIFLTIAFALTPRASSRIVEKAELELEACAYTGALFTELLKFAGDNTLFVREHCCASQRGKTAFNLGAELTKGASEEILQQALGMPSDYVGIDTTATSIRLKMGLYLFSEPKCCHRTPENPGTTNYLCP